MPVKTLPFLASRFFALYLLYVVSVTIAREWGVSAIDYIMADVRRIATWRGIYSETAINILFALFFWFKAEWLAHTISGKYANQEIGPALHLENTQAAGFVVVGLAIASNAIEPFGRLFWMLINIAGGVSYTNYSKTMGFPFFTGVFWLIWGGIIIFNASRLVHLAEKCGRKMSGK